MKKFIKIMLIIFLICNIGKADDGRQNTIEETIQSPDVMVNSSVIYKSRPLSSILAGSKKSSMDLVTAMTRNEMNNAVVDNIDYTFWKSILNKGALTTYLNKPNGKFVFVQDQNLNKNDLYDLLNELAEMQGSQAVRDYGRAAPPSPIGADVSLFEPFYDLLTDKLNIANEDAPDTTFPFYIGIDSGYNDGQQMGEWYNPDSTGVEVGGNRYRTDLIMQGYLDQDYYVDDGTISLEPRDNPLLVDTDFDGLFTYGELKFNTDPNNRDTDGDSIMDGVEIAMGFDPLLPLDYPLDFNMPDTDGEGLFDRAEGMFGTDINNPDTDGDGYSDYWEVMHGTDPLDPNSPGEFPDRIVRPNSRLEAIKALINSTAASDTLDSVAISEYQITTTENNRIVEDSPLPRFIWKIYDGAEQIGEEQTVEPILRRRWHKAGLYRLEVFQDREIVRGDRVHYHKNDYWIMQGTGQLLWNRHQDKLWEDLNKGAPTVENHKIKTIYQRVTDDMLGDNWIIEPGEQTSDFNTERIE